MSEETKDYIEVTARISKSIPKKELISSLKDGDTIEIIQQENGDIEVNQIFP
jgi:hypothetical protein